MGNNKNKVFHSYLGFWELQKDNISLGVRERFEGGGVGGLRVA